MLFANLSSQERKLYGLIGTALAVALVLGLLGGLISFGGSGLKGGDNWQASSVPVTSDSLAEFTSVSTQPRWFQEAGVAAQSPEAIKKALEGQPESLKLIGIVERGGIRYALFIPADPNAGRTAKQYSAGEALVGDWKVKEITAGSVTVIAEKEGAEPQTRELSLYQAKK